MRTFMSKPAMQTLASSCTRLQRVRSAHLRSARSLLQSTCKQVHERDAFANLLERAAAGRNHADREGAKVSVTIKDVAAAVGVSASTVSRAFGRPEKVDEVTRLRILAAAETWATAPTGQQALNTGRTGCIGAILPDLENPFFAGLLKGIEQAAEELGYQILVADSGENVAAERRAIDALSPQVDGLLLCSTRLEDDEVLRINELRPLVLVNRSVGDLPHVSFDNQSGMQEALRHLLALGHRRIGYAGGNLLSRSARQRLRAFEVTSDDPGFGVTGQVLGEFPPTFEGGGAAADVALNANVTAVVVYNDIMAIGLMHRLLSYGLSLPARLSVVSFDNVPIAAMVTFPDGGRPAEDRGGQVGCRSTHRPERRHLRAGRPHAAMCFSRPDSSCGDRPLRPARSPGPLRLSAAPAWLAGSCHWRKLKPYAPPGPPPDRHEGGCRRICRGLRHDVGISTRWLPTPILSGAAIWVRNRTRFGQNAGPIFHWRRHAR